jgi:hypothetical protein
VTRDGGLYGLRNAQIEQPRVGVDEFPTFVAAQDEVHQICTAIGERVKSGTSPPDAIAAEMNRRFGDGHRLDEIGRLAFTMMTALISEFRSGKR